jgi:hypothetical protein
VVVAVVVDRALLGGRLERGEDDIVVVQSTEEHFRRKDVVGDFAG